MCVLVGNTEGVNVYLTFVMFFAKVGVIKAKGKRNVFLSLNKADE